MIGTIEQIRSWLLNQKQNKMFQIKEYHQKRSLSQNAYAWALISQMADLLRMSKEEMYLQMLMDYGQSTLMRMLSSINPDSWYKYYEPLGLIVDNNKEYMEYRVFKGSSEFDSREMSIFIDGIIRECEQLGIHTLTMEQIQKMRLV